MAGGPLRNRVTLQHRAVQTGHVTTLADWTDVATGWHAEIVANRYSSFESEEVQSERLTGVGMFMIRLRYAVELAGISTTWRVVDDATGDVFNIRHVEIKPRGEFVILACDQGRDP